MANITGTIAIDIRFKEDGLHDKVTTNHWEHKQTDLGQFDFIHDCPYKNGDKVLTINNYGSYYILPPNTNPNLIFQSDDDWTVAFWYKCGGRGFSDYCTILNGCRYYGRQRLALYTKDYPDWCPVIVPDNGIVAHDYTSFISIKDKGPFIKDWKDLNRYHYISFQKKDKHYMIHVDGCIANPMASRIVDKYFNSNKPGHVPHQWDFNTGGTGLFNEATGENNGYLTGQVFDIVVIKGQALWNGRYYYTPKKYLTEGGYDNRVWEDPVMDDNLVMY